MVTLRERQQIAIRMAQQQRKYDGPEFEQPPRRAVENLIPRQPRYPNAIRRRQKRNTYVPQRSSGFDPFGDDLPF